MKPAGLLSYSLSICCTCSSTIKSLSSLLGLLRSAFLSLPIAFIIIFIIADALTWQGLLSLLPLGGTISGTISYWQKRTKWLRLLALISPPLWFTYNFISHSYPGMLTEIFLISSTLIAIYRFDIRKTSSKKATRI